MLGFDVCVCGCGWALYIWHGTLLPFTSQDGIKPSETPRNDKFQPVVVYRRRFGQIFTTWSPTDNGNFLQRPRGSEKSFLFHLVESLLMIKFRDVTDMSKGA